MKRVVVIGLGNFGQSVADTLARRGHDVIAVDRDQEVVDRIAHRAARAVVGDGTSAELLAEIGCRDADIGVVATGDDLTASILATLALHDVGVPAIYVKVVSDEHARVVEKLGVTDTVFPERESGRRLAEHLASAGVLNFIPLAPGYSLQEMAVPDVWVARTLRELDLRRNYRVSVMALHDMLQGEIVTLPDPDAPLKESDTLFISGHDDDLRELRRIT